MHYSLLVHLDYSFKQLGHNWNNFNLFERLVEHELVQGSSSDLLNCKFNDSLHLLYKNSLQDWEKI
jgi:hypothetical protein